MLLIITSTGVELLSNVNIDDLERLRPPLPLKSKEFSKNFRDFERRHTFQEYIAPKWLEINPDNLRKCV